MILETERLILRWPEMVDREAYFEIFSDPEVTRYWFEPAWTHISQADERLKKLSEKSTDQTAFPFSIVQREFGAVIGTCTLFNLSPQCRRAEIGYALGRNHWQKGFAREALHRLINFGFTDLGLNRIEADIDPNNEQSAKLLRTLGFRVEGLLRERWIVGGVVSDTELYGLLATDWAAHNSV